MVPSRTFRALIDLAAPPFFCWAPTYPEMGPHVGPMGPNWARRDGILFWGGMGLTWDVPLHIELEGLLLCFTYTSPYLRSNNMGPSFL